MLFIGKTSNVLTIMISFATAFFKRLSERTYSSGVRGYSANQNGVVTSVFCMRASCR